MKIFVDETSKIFFYWLSKIDSVEITDSLEDCDFILISLQINVDKLEDIKNIIENLIKIYDKYFYKIIAFLDANYKSRSIKNNPRKGYEVDKNIKQYLNKNIKYFTCLDMFDDNLVFIPGCPTPRNYIKQPAGYYKDYFDNTNNYYNKIFFRGQLSHDDRNKVINKLQSYNDSRLDIKLIDISIYNDKVILPDNHYKNYIEQLKQSDIALFLRGDRDMCYNFWDYLRCNVIPCFYGNVSYKNLGFEKIGYKFEDLFIYIEHDELDVMYEKLNNILNNKDLILRMKSQLNDFYNKHIVPCPLYKNSTEQPRPLQRPKMLDCFCEGFVNITCHSHFFIRKLLEIKNNNYRLINNKYFSSEVNGLL
jgi:hypothetical protein